jgi:L-2-hydroxyglutarate oxidase LhgO
MYYPTGSLKSTLCIEGNRLLYDYAKDKNISCRKIGKYIIASKEHELEKLNNLYNQGLSSGVSLKMIAKEEIQNLYPDLVSAGAIFSPESGIIDVPELVTALEGDIQHNKGVISLKTSFISAIKSQDNFRIKCDDGNEFEINSKILINSSGLDSEINTRKIFSLDDKYNLPINLAKGHYFKYSGKHPFKNLIYPLSNEFSQGIHAGFDLSGQLRFGPDINWVSNLDFSFDESVKDNFIDSIQQYWPEMNPDKLQPDYVGIRPKIQNQMKK